MLPTGDSFDNCHPILQYNAVFETQEAIYLQGWLNMERKGALGLSDKNRLQKRWFQLRGSLIMYAAKQDGKQIGFFHCGGATVNRTKAPFTFTVEVPERKYSLQAESNEDLEKWAHAVAHAAAGTAQLENSVFRQSFSMNSGVSGSVGKGIRRFHNKDESAQRWRVVSAATVRKQAARDSAKVGTLKEGTVSTGSPKLRLLNRVDLLFFPRDLICVCAQVIDALEQRVEVGGQTRVRISHGRLKGWTSIRATNGATLLVRDLESMTDDFSEFDT
jgi:hypothetical protein